MYGIDLYNIKNRDITIGTNKEKKLSLDIYQISAQDPLEELLNEVREGQFSTTLTSKQKLSLLKIMRKNRPAFSIGEEPLGKIRGYDIELYLDVERPYPPMLRRPPYPDELLEMDVIRRTGHNEIMEITTPVLITWNDCKSRLCGYFRALNKYTKADRYPIPRIPHALEKLAKAKYITKIDYLLALGHKVSGLSLAIDQNKVAEVLLKPVAKKIKEMQSFLGFSSYYRNHSRDFAHITSSLYKICSKDVVFEITKERRNAYQGIRHELTNAPVLILPDIELPLKLYIDAACSQGLGAALHERQIVDGEPREGVICYISRQLKYLEARYGATQTECLCLVWALEKFYYYLEGAVFEVYTNCTALKSLLSIKSTDRHIWPQQMEMDNFKRHPAYDPEVSAKIPIHLMEIDRRKNVRFSEWAPECGTPNSGDDDSEGPETPILNISFSELHN
ncbi:hypothetical protein O181_034465 [Austropuccinia psidii MF-1]|uniref:Reverse transcriptase/retrotransposon-derived protein RNase H-like domain-containing protein n=1 Tax=Austropuccinia psidii MF-1 TaxID=1389203 RepID=A0A9Q3D505_9BASI|nr:hypothetical protein [Austropuccinia psidii MF-1]